MTAAPPRSVLIVEDDRDIRETIAELIAEFGYRALTAEHGQQALEVLRTTAEPPCVILLDLSMPIMDGYKFRTAQLADPAIASVPVIIMTADNRVEDKRVRLNCRHAIQKPMSADALRDLLLLYR